MSTQLETFDAKKETFDHLLDFLASCQVWVPLWLLACPIQEMHNRGDSFTMKNYLQDLPEKPNMPVLQSKQQFTSLFFRALGNRNTCSRCASGSFWHTQTCTRCARFCRTLPWWVRACLACLCTRRRSTSLSFRGTTTAGSS